MQEEDLKNYNSIREDVRPLAYKDNIYSKGHGRGKTKPRVYGRN